MSYNKPHICDCFGIGYCWKHLGCRSKPAVQQAIREARAEKPQPTQTEIRAWRDDGSHERGPVPKGRLPKGWED